jgi:hypothetical protein
VEGNLKFGGLMVKVMDGRFPRMAKFVAIFSVKVIRMFFDFKGFSNETKEVMRGCG